MATTLGLDIGGSGIKGAPVDLDAGDLAAERVREPTPQPATPEAVAKTVKAVVGSFKTDGPIGCTFPAVIKNGTARTAANVDDAWVYTDVAATLSDATSREVFVVNDADAAGLAEVRYGAGKDVRGVVLVVTLGTGIGTGLFLDGGLVPNTELGHIEIDGHDAETRASDAARDREGLDWEHWAKRVTRYLGHLENLIWPDLIIVGGGVSKKSQKWLHFVDIRTKIVPAELKNEAGIVGAALFAAESAVSG